MTFLWFFLLVISGGLCAAYTLTTVAALLKGAKVSLLAILIRLALIAGTGWLALLAYHRLT